MGEGEFNRDSFYLKKGGLHMNKWMNRLYSGFLAMALVFTLFAIPVAAAEIDGYEVKGIITIDEQYYDRDGDTSTSGFLSRYQYYPSDDQYNRLNIPQFDISIHKKGEEHPSFEFQRFSPWLKNDRMLLKLDPVEGVKFDLDYMRYRKNLEEFSPTTTGAVGSEYTARFNNDALTSEFFVERSKTDLSLSLGSEIWGGTEKDILDSVTIWINDEDKRGRKHLSYLLGGSDVVTGGVSSRWRGRPEPFDSRVVNIGTELTLRPCPKHDLDAFLRIERENFESDDLYTVADVAALDSNVVSSTKSIDFIPDAKKDSYSLDIIDRFYDDLIYRFGIRYANLNQESRNAGQVAAGYNGEIKTTTLLASALYTGVKNTDLTGFYYYNQRENNSDVGITGYKDLDSNVSSPHVAEITSQKYGGDAVYRLDRYNSVIRLSGRRDVVDREFQRPWGSQAIPFFASPYTIETDRWIYSAGIYSRFIKDLFVTASASLEIADDTALVLEPDEAWSGHVMATYTMLDGRAAVSASYMEEMKENDDFRFFGTGATNNIKFTSNFVDQDWESRHRSLNLNGWWQVRDDLNIFGAYMRDVLLEDTNWLLVQDTRWSAQNIFLAQEKGLGYKSYNDTVSLGVNYQVNPKKILLVSYLVSDSRSRINSGTASLWSTRSGRNRRPRCCAQERMG